MKSLVSLVRVQVAPPNQTLDYNAYVMKRAKAAKRKNTQHWNILGLFIFLATTAVTSWLVQSSTPKLPQPSLKELGQRRGIDIGVHALDHRLDNRIYPDLVAGQFDVLVIDREAHWDGLQPSRNGYDYKKTDELVSFADKYHMKVQLHHLIWGERNWLPGWLKENNFSAEWLRQLQKEYIQNVVGYYKGRVQQWTVSNEAFTRKEHHYNLRDWWADHGVAETEDIDNYFRWAKQTDPNAILILNDFDNETKNSISNSMFEYIKAARGRGVPIDGIGMQLHINATHPPEKTAVVENINRFGGIGVPVYVTEFDVNINKLDGTTAQKMAIEAKITYDMTRACIESGSCVSFSVFGVTDKNDRLKWLLNTDSHSFLFNSHFQPKPSYWAFRQALIDP